MALRFMLLDQQILVITHIIQEEVYLLSQRVKLQEASMQGLLLDPNAPITPEVPEVAQPMPMAGDPNAMPPEAGGMPQEVLKMVCLCHSLLAE